jgi:hypothetical protein
MYPVTIKAEELHCETDSTQNTDHERPISSFVNLYKINSTSAIDYNQQVWAAL